jgi:2-dehydropantoate 2-reductase
MSTDSSFSDHARWFRRSPILVWGAGAIGGTVAAFLARQGVPVRVVDIVTEHVQACRSTGLVIEGPVAQFSQRLDAVTPSDLLQGVHDCVLLAVKAQHTGEALAQLAPHLSPDGVVVSLQNGLNEQRIAAAVGAQRTIGGFVNFAADYLAPGRISLGNRGALKLGEMRRGITPRAQSLATLLGAFDPDTAAVDDIFGFKWGKLAYGSLLFATALANETMSESLADPAHRSLFTALAREVLGVAAQAGVTPIGFDGFDPAAFAAGATDRAAADSLTRMAEHYRHSSKQRSGVWRDLAVRKRRTEIDSQIAEIVRVAQSLGSRAPITEILVRLIHDIEDGRRAIDRSNLLEFADEVRRLELAA